MYIFDGLLFFITYLKNASKSQNSSKFVAEHEILTN
jgi:hypothetical protein